MGAAGRSRAGGLLGYDRDSCGRAEHGGAKLGCTSYFKHGSDKITVKQFLYFERLEKLTTWQCELLGQKK
jgi:hypothetical protein